MQHIHVIELFKFDTRTEHASMRKKQTFQRMLLSMNCLAFYKRIKSHKISKPLSNVDSHHARYYLEHMKYQGIAYYILVKRLLGFEKVLRDNALLSNTIKGEPNL